MKIAKKPRQRDRAHSPYLYLVRTDVHCLRMEWTADIAKAESFTVLEWLHIKARTFANVVALP